ncbi:MAG: glycogen/starch/alpha-glucan phosphorylase [Acuticoccus sp.]
MHDAIATANPSDLPAITAEKIRARVEHHLAFSIGRSRDVASLTDWRVALSHAMRDLLVLPWFASQERADREKRKRVYYLSMEFLIGRLLQDAASNLGVDEAARRAMADLGVDYAAVVESEPDAALGNGGLGRLAACCMDAMATVGIAAMGYGIRYDHGIFEQGFVDGWQSEEAEDWLAQSHVWEFERREATYPIRFGGETEHVEGDRALWRAADTVLAAAYDTPVPGWKARWVNTLRLWSAKPTREFELQAFNRGDFFGAAAPAVLAQTISRVLYPDDSTHQGRELRLKQEYFFTAASIADILRRFDQRHTDLRAMPDNVAIQLNDTHPAIAAPELIRRLVDERALPFDEAYDIARGCLSYTNHTLMPEALERWPVDMFRETLPRHYELIGRIEERHARDCAAAGRPRSDSVKIIGDGEVRMGELAFIGAHKVNGVSALHTELVKETVFADLHALHPDRIVNETNGVTPRRWLYGCNAPLRALITDTIGDSWVDHLDELDRLTPHADDAAFRERFAAAKRQNKEALAHWIARERAIKVDPDAIFDIQVKRFHEYKRQLLNVLETIALYNEIKRDPEADRPARVKIFGGKAAPGYFMAKLIVKLINDVAAKVNGDPDVRTKLTVIFPPNYNVSMAERLIPAADLSEQISTAGMEASGTGNMKFALNGALTIGTMDGANVEICDCVGRDNIFIFGLTTEEVAERRQTYNVEETIAGSPRLREVLDQIGSGHFSPEQPDRFKGIIEALYHGDHFMVCADFDAYYQTQRTIEHAWRGKSAWTRSAVLNTAKCGFFSIDRTIRGYARDIWGVEPAL